MANIKHWVFLSTRSMWVFLKLKHNNQFGNITHCIASYFFFICFTCPSLRNCFSLLLIVAWYIGGNLEIIHKISKQHLFVCVYYLHNQPPVEFLCCALQLNEPLFWYTANEIQTTIKLATTVMQSDINLLGAGVLN